MLQLKQYNIKGIVQGVGFRPFVYRIAKTYKLSGWVLNDAGGVTIEVEGPEVELNRFVAHLTNNPPPLAVINEVTVLRDEPSEGTYTSFEIKQSEGKAERQALVSPDTNVCDNCLEELFAPGNRRYRYPFINCTNCGPRYTIIQDIPYDRPFTTMKDFPLCPECNGEYHDPLDRRFHAQPNACWTCGPRVQLLNNQGEAVDSATPVRETVKLLKQGHIVAIKGVGGYHLVVDPTNHEAVLKLRQRKRRNFKPFALMAETADHVKKFARVSPEEEKLLTSTERPIVLLQKQQATGFSPALAPNNQQYGVMLAYTPLHYLLLRDNFTAIVATSGNVTDQPIVYKEVEALNRLSNIAEYFLVHNRDIHTRVDDSIVRYVPRLDSAYIIRRARGYVPRPVSSDKSFPSVLALGGELKNTICLNKDNKFFLSHHIGDLKNLQIFDSMSEVITHLSHILNITPVCIASDLHPDFRNTRYVFEQDELPIIQVQHHHAHMASCMFENNLKTPTIGVIFDGLGYGLNKQVWGGEFLVGDYYDFERAAHFQPFSLLGGDKAVKEPYRIALAFLFEIYGADVANLGLDVVTKRSEMELELLQKMADKQINAPQTSSMGRIFDAVSALLGVCDKIEYEAQAAIELEQVIQPTAPLPSPLPYQIYQDNKAWKINVLPMFQRLVELLRTGQESQSDLSLRFHQTIVQIVTDICQRLRQTEKINDVVLSGGVFLNQFLLINCYTQLSQSGFKVYTHKKVPTNDGGISLGQAVVAGYHIARSNRNPIFDSRME